MIKQIIFDFDGVILDSLAVKESAFRFALCDFPIDAVNILIQYHREHGGVSRFEKFRYFLNVIMQQAIDEREVAKFSESFSVYCKQRLSDPCYIIQETVDFIGLQYQKLTLHVASGAEEQELKLLCKRLELSHYFKSIHGSPTPKDKLVANILRDYHYSPDEVLLIGDAMTDYQAAKASRIRFSGYKNLVLEPLSDYYIHSFKNFDLEYIK